MELWAAFLIGLAGSLHCIGMCGPIAIALAPGDSSRFHHLAGRVLYNLGRSVTYGLMGLVAGLIGRTIHVSGYQQGLSIGLGVLLLLAIILPSKFGAFIAGSKLHARLTAKLAGLWGRLIGHSSMRSLFTIGILNGFLPCGLVYVALAGAIATGNPVTGGLYMVVFGLGTLPVMLAISLAGRLLGTGFRNKLRRLIPVGGVLLATLFILRGLSLGIPMVSPKPQMNDSGEMTMECHHHEGAPSTTNTTEAAPADGGGD